MSQATPCDTSIEHLTWQYDGFGRHRLLPPSASIKRSRSPEVRTTVEAGNEQNPTIDCKREKYTKELSDEPGEVKAEQQVGTRTLSARQRSEILRKYGERLADVYMKTFAKHDHDTAELLMYAGSKMIDGVIERKYKSLEELHDEYEHHLGTYYSHRVPEYVQLELQKIRRTAPIWWADCLKMRYHHQKMTLAGTVLGEIGWGKYRSL